MTLLTVVLLLAAFSKHSFLKALVRMCYTNQRFTLHCITSSPIQFSNIQPYLRWTKVLPTKAILTELNFCLRDMHRQWTCCYWTHSLSIGHCDRQTISTHGSCPKTFIPILSKNACFCFAASRYFHTGGLVRTACIKGAMHLRTGVLVMDEKRMIGSGWLSCVGVSYNIVIYIKF